MRKLRTVANEYGSVLIGETWTANVAQLKDYYGAKNDELQMPMDLMMTGFSGLHAQQYRDHIAEVNSSGQWPVWVITNHDIVRSYTRYADGAHNDDIAKLMGALYLTLRGSAIMYYGEEIGMENNIPKSRDEVQDPIGKIGWPIEKGRDGERTPMQWTDGVNAGFSTVKPWLPVPASAKTHNVETEAKDPDSILNFYRQLLALRHKEPTLLEGDYFAINEDDPNVLVYLRRYKDEAIMVVLNMSATQQKVQFNLAPAGFSAPKLSLLLTNAHAPVTAASDGLTMQPFAVFIAKVTK